ncbi:SusC/RagA family TonB-linked outer membrane protein [Flavobacterium sp. SUN052]|uniref:SusC/RagA family TonB-linked outer membrane protein n=1 Tax=Flavobacterium sp. SUN052 TaxID=3002441 RepID=UPI00237DDABE|nr:SusC/RagA family TonB-linked outer membrane protein [Flavobacterium sp. SUN052]MEC4004828.1 SusC/RagA family TonB-linked outer membrane protein [Flavobacterium sp. SUN052]
MNKNSIFNGGSAFWYFIICYCLTINSVAAGSKSSSTALKVTDFNYKQLQQQPLNQVQSKQQNNTIYGSITDSNGVLAGVTVSVKDKNISTISDADGKYSITAEKGAVLVFSFVGYKSVSVTVGSTNSINVVLQADAQTLEEVTVNAGYYKVKDKERTGSIAKITSKDIENQPVTNVLAAMQGRMAGVSITQTTGTPGGGFDVQIRGQNSLRAAGNVPLYVIDGVPYATDPVGSGMASGIFSTQPSPLNSINPDQIASIEVLKDADATAIYGSRGANGVVLISTKKGKSGKTVFSATVSQGAGRVTRFLDLMNTEQYLQMRREAFANDGIPIPSYAYDVNGTWDQNRSTDWQKELFGGTASLSNLQASLSGGSAQTQFLLSGTYGTQTTVFPGTFTYKKGNVHFSLNHSSLDKKFKVAFTAGYTSQGNNQPRVDLVQEAITIAPNAPALYQSDGTLNWENNTFNNPLRNLEGKYQAKTNDLIASTLFTYELSPYWSLKSSLGYTTTQHDETAASPFTKYNPAYGLGSAYSSLIVSGAQRHSWIFEPQIGWKHALGGGIVDALLGSTLQQQQGSMLVQYASGFASNSLIYNLASATNLYTLVSDASVYKYQAFFGRVNYNYKEKYLLNVTGRRDGSSRFGPGRQFAYFGAVGAAWLFSNESFLKGQKVLSFGKLRGSYGSTGNDQIGDYQYLDTYASSGVNYGGVVGLQPTRLFNPVFGWETSTKLELALELGFMQDRIFLTSGWYRNLSSNQLTGIPLPGTTGFSNLQANLDATVVNRGLEFTLRTVNFQKQHWSWTTNFNISIARNKLLSFPDLANSSYSTQYVIGQALNIRKVYHFTGVDPQTGLYTFADVNGDSALTSRDDKTEVKDLNPKFYGGFQNTFKYQQWQLDFLFQFVKQENYNASVISAYPGSGFNQPVSVLDHWQQPGTISSHQLYTDGSNSAAVDAYYKYVESDAAISDASYIRLKNISLSYELPVKTLKCRLFFQGQNVLTFTHYNGLDPEFKSAGYLPPLRVLSFGTQLTF